jgi:iron(II)-dependent oxidoreductase
MKRCHACQLEFPDTCRFCGGCGGALNALAPPEVDSLRCPHCAAAVRAGWKFCGKCRSRLVALNVQPQSEATVTASLRVSESIAPSPVEQQRNGEQPRCPSCRVPVEEDGGDFCEHCGSNIVQAAGRAAAPAHPQPAAKDSSAGLIEESLAPPAELPNIEPRTSALPPTLPASEETPDDIISSVAPLTAEENILLDLPDARPVENPAGDGDTRPAYEQVERASPASPAAVAAGLRAKLPAGRSRAVILGVGALVLASAVLMGIFSLWPRRAAPSPLEDSSPSASPGSPAVSASSLPGSKAIPVAPENMVFVPGGDFRMGRDNGDAYERPAHLVAVKPFYLDKYEVTCEQYGKFVEETGHAHPPSWENGHYPTGNATLPVTGVSWDDATAYAQWARKRLPTEEEWEFAARGDDGRLYPWGSEWKPKAANAADTSAGKMIEVGYYPAGASPFGALDMVGNAWEWTASNASAYPGGKSPEKLENNLKVIRGNFWGSKTTQATATYRGFWAASDAKTYRDTGFRCAKDIEAAPSR